MFTVILVFYNFGKLLTRLPSLVSPLLPSLTLPRIKFGIVLNQNTTSFPQLRLALSLVISPSFSYKVSVSLGALAAGIAWIYRTIYPSS